MSSIVRLTPKGHTYNTRPHVFLKSVLQSGVGQSIIQLKRVNFKFCETSDESKYARRFVEEKLVNFARKHPSVSFYVIPETGVKPSLSIEFLNGREEFHDFTHLDADEITKSLEMFATRSGLEIFPLKKNIHTDCPSIQGQWTPFTNKKHRADVKLDLSIKKIDAWKGLDISWEKFYRASEKDRLKNRPQLTKEEKLKMPLGKFGPALKPIY